MLLGGWAMTIVVVVLVLGVLVSVTVYLRVDAFDTQEVARRSRP